MHPARVVAGAEVHGNLNAALVGRVRERLAALTEEARGAHVLVQGILGRAVERELRLAGAF